MEANPEGSSLKNFRQLKVWRKAHELTLAIHQVTPKFPREEVHGLTAQLSRSSASIAANIAEGCGRDGDAELARFCSIAPGSASEVEYHLLLAKDLNLLEPNQHERLQNQTTEVKRMLTVFIQKLKADS